MRDQRRGRDGLVSLPLALAGGLVIGIVEAVLFVNVPNPGAVDLVLFLAVLVLVFIRGGSRVEETGTWSLSPKVKGFVPPQAWYVDLSSLDIG